MLRQCDGHRAFSQACWPPLRSEGLTVVLTTHDLNWVAAHLPRLVCLNKAVIADGPPSAVLQPGVPRDTFGADVSVIEHQGRMLVTEEAAPMVAS